ncbi:MAG: DUF1801 domain-containing protein [Candidatus Gracilibacteria bacterium]|nr:DUF1801 domain-containing protein [Candidatus Gracilibacteria bacterium]
MQDTKTIDDYISGFPSDVQIILQKIRKIIIESNPDLVEIINYGVPTFKLNGKNMVHFGAFKKHISIFPGPEAIEHFSTRLGQYKISKGTIQFSLDKEIPYDLIGEIVRYKINP